MHSEEMEQWLLSLPLGEAIDIDGEQAYLNLGEGGAEIGVILLAEPNQAQIADAMRTGFQAALEFEAGLALSPEGGELLLNRWLPGVEAWSDAAEALEDILNHASLWRALMAAGSGPGEAVLRDDARMRRALNGV